MSAAGRARIAAYVLAYLVVGAVALVGLGRTRPAPPSWRDALRRADASLVTGDARAARRAWEDAYRAARRDRSWEGLLAVGHGQLRLGAATDGRQAAVPEARRVFLAALVQARQRRDAGGVAEVAEAFAALGDRDVADQAFQVALALAIQSRDAATHARVAALAARRDYGRRAP